MRAQVGRYFDHAARPRRGGAISVQYRLWSSVGGETIALHFDQVVILRKTKLRKGHYMGLLGRALCIVFAGSLGSPLWSLESYFVETFDGPDQNPSLKGYDEFVIQDGELQRQTGDPGDQDRAYMRTALSDYNTRDFVFDVVFTTGHDTITFVGLGPGDWQGREPGPSMTFRIHAPDVVGGRIDVASNLGSDVIGNLLTTGPHCARIEKSGAQVTFSVDLDFNGQFEADASRSYSDISELGPFLNDQDSRLFFGGGSQTTQFDTVTIAASNAPIFFRRGDANVDGAFNITDPVRILNYAFAGAEIRCVDAADVDDDGLILITDAIGLLGYLYLGTIAPPEPFLECGLDKSSDELGCEEYGACGGS